MKPNSAVVAGTGIITALVFALSVEAAAEEPKIGERELQATLAEDVTLSMTIRGITADSYDWSRCATSGKRCYVTGARAFGTEDTRPLSEIADLTLIWSGQRVSLEDSQMFNPESPREDKKLSAWIAERNEDEIVVRAEFGIGAVAYLAEWRVTKSGSVRTLLNCLECHGLACTAFYPSINTH